MGNKVESNKGIIESIIFLTKLTVLVGIIVIIFLITINVIALLFSSFMPVYISDIVISIIFIIYIVIILIFGRKNYYDLKIKEINLTNENIKNDINIIYLADFQFDRKDGNYNVRAFNNLLNKLANIDFDLLLIGGDYVNYKSHLNIFVDEMRELSKKYKIISVFGNHDHAWKNEFRTKLDKVGVCTLENDYQIVNVRGEEVCIIGLEDEWTGSPEYPKLKEETDKLTKLVLIHNPDTIKKIQNEKFDLTLAGHYHAGQVNLIPGLHIARIVTKYVYGMHKVDQSLLYVTSGVGGTFFRGLISFYVRWNARPEIVKISIQSK